VVGVAADGDQGMARATETRPDVVILDRQMPGMSGLAACQRIRELVPAARVLILTADFPDDWLVLAALLAGAVGLLTKGVDLGRLVDAGAPGGAGGGAAGTRAGCRRHWKACAGERPPAQTAG
jgi:NarL family two-component system response regulator LiaR